MIKFYITSILVLIFFQTNAQQVEVTVTIGYADHESYFIYSIPPTDENARFGGEYYFKVENTGSVDLNDFKLYTRWPTLNSTWGVVEKTVINSSTGDILIEGPSWDTDLSTGESFVLNGEWIATASVEDWIEFLPRNITMTANGGTNVAIQFDTLGEVSLSNYDVQKVLPYHSDRKTYTPLKTVAYFPIFDAENAWCSLLRYGANIDQLRVQLYSIDPAGNLRAGQDLPVGVDPIGDLDYWYDYIDSIGVIDYCVNNNIELIPVVYNYNGDIDDFDQQAVHTMMISPQIRADHLNSLEGLLINHPEFDGIDIDYESLMASDKENYSLLMEDLATIVHSHEKILTTAVHTKVGPGTWYGPQAQDYQRIGNAVDEMLIMTYDLHWATSPTFTDPPPTAGCQATPDWMNDVLAFATMEISDPSKVQLGLPFYGYRWKHLFESHDLNDPGVGLTYNDAMNLLAAYNINPSSLQRDPNGNERNFIVNINGVDWIGYYQDGPSLSYKLQSLDEHDIRDYIGGVGIWRIGQESDEMWNAYCQSVYGTDAIIDNGVDCSIPPTNDLTESVLEYFIYPNPTSNLLNVIVPNGATNIRILSQNGQEVYKTDLIGDEVELDVSNISSGNYLIEILTSSEKYQTEIVIKH